LTEGDGDEVVKILDFGVANLMLEYVEHEKALKQTSAVLSAFTPAYGAPEQFSRSHGATGPWTDVFASAFALVLVELMRGGRPALVGDEFIPLANKSIHETVRPTPRHHGIPVTDEVEAVSRRALAVQPADRYANMRDFWAALRDAVFPGERSWTPPSLGVDVAPTGARQARCRRRRSRCMSDPDECNKPLGRCRQPLESPACWAWSKRDQADSDITLA
jgi:serine/threonine protein kinase